MLKAEAETNVTLPKSRRAMALYRESNSHGYIEMIA